MPALIRRVPDWTSMVPELLKGMFMFNVPAPALLRSVPLFTMLIAPPKLLMKPMSLAASHTPRLSITVSVPP